MKRSRGRGRRQQNPVNRSYDSNGPDVRVRGTASQVYEKYQALARDAMSSGDRVMAENYGQHAEHYYRIMLSFQPAPGETDKETGKEAANGGAAGADANGAEPTADGGSEPLVLMRENGADGEGDGDKPTKPSRRRGPLRNKKADNGNTDGNSDAAPQENSAESSEEVIAADTDGASEAPVTVSD